MVTRGPRSARRLTAHPVPAAAPAYRPGGPVRGLAPVDPLPPAPSLSVPPPPPLSREQARALARRAWGWRALLGGWAALLAAVVWAGLRWVGPASLGCPAVMLATELALAWCAVVDLRQRAAEMRAEG
ncbi:hypothetical protein GA0070606_5377 [Micromonospora citrea]|uniref:Uncharacterized protein n=1 Tax=Micromonospora citrea TaxID=47855 RepID=A0A1C6VVP0_9ACTN|nr:hypothetical protein [Micromonospora citrea]SCL70365.1 hypothetical protein GA0070606_5377 [Micromonospora citrea]